MRPEGEMEEEEEEVEEEAGAGLVKMDKEEVMVQETCLFVCLPRGPSSVITILVLELPPSKGLCSAWAPDVTPCVVNHVSGLTHLCDLVLPLAGR